MARGRRSNATGRTETEQYLPISYAMAQSPAFRSLTGPALKVWIELRSRFNGNNNGRLTLSWDEAARLLNLGKATVGRAFDEIEEKGFVVMMKRGHWYGRAATTWAVTDRSVEGHNPTHAWKHWRPGSSVLRRTVKTEIGSQADHNSAVTGPPENRDAKIWSATEPVRGPNGTVIGSEADHL